MAIIIFAGLVVAGIVGLVLLKVRWAKQADRRWASSAASRDDQK